ncbi:deoxyguanosine kinase [Bacillus mesophilus]|uniref:Deoxynucleoside kinase n=1 Tax=Bacillus mesophilus TaxID=1808955 RepID=A0A6M0QCZ8_9BACI|nr:deoxynucleoside kinase [Bacillus mesophilus]MBM7663505.1 deoxyguanosine kinase [Bacillus mesophilus]NEY74224.1 deoxynucleoside kinase [Bacillus mesophilus]
MSQTPFITVEGPIGVGKTSLAKEIANRFHYHLLKEIVDENPFLGKFYTNIEEWSFQTEMFFLCNRYKQLEDIHTSYLKKNQPVVADYHIMKNMIFADRTLNEYQSQKYRQIYEILTNDMPEPNVIIYLHASLDTLLHRVAKRGREIEKQMSAAYLQQLIEDYERAMELFQVINPHIPIIRLSGDDLDFVMNEQDLETILETIESTVKGRAAL